MLRFRQIKLPKAAFTVFSVVSVVPQPLNFRPISTGEALLRHPKFQGSSKKPTIRNVSFIRNYVAAEVVMAVFRLGILDSA